MSEPFKVICIGAGIGGLITALASHQLGVRVDVYERNKEITELGAGVAMFVTNITL